MAFNKNLFSEVDFVADIYLALDKKIMIKYSKY